MSPKRLSSAIRKPREANGLTQEEVAMPAQVTKNYITMPESGARESPSRPVLKRRTKTLGVPITALLE